MVWGSIFLKTGGAPRTAVLDSKLVDFWGGPGDDAYIWFWGRFSRIQRKKPGVRPRCIFTDNSRAGWCLQGFADWAKMHFHREFSSGLVSRRLRGMGPAQVNREFSSGLVSKRLRGMGPAAFLPRILERIGFQRASGIRPKCIFTEKSRAD